MYLPDFIGTALSEDDEQAAFPLSLELPHKMTVRFKILLLKGIREKKELGHALYYNKNTAEVTFSHLCTGSSHGINLPGDDSERNFGNVHCHPSLSYKEAQPAHSPADVNTFRDNCSKPVFISFVASGDAYTNYALVSKEGVTTYKQSVVTEIMRETSPKLLTFFDTHCPLNENTRNEMMSDLSVAKTSTQLRREHHQSRSRGRRPKMRAPLKGSKTEAFEAMNTALQRLTPGFGQYGEEVSIANMKTVVEQCGFAFYRSERGKPGTLVRCQW